MNRTQQMFEGETQGISSTTTQLSESQKEVNTNIKEGNLLDNRLSASYGVLKKHPPQCLFE